MLLSSRHHLQRILPVLFALVALCAFMAQETRARPFNGQERRDADVNPFPDSIDTAENASTHKSCYKEVTETFANGTQSRIVTECCDGYKGENCDELVESTSNDENVNFDPADPCKNLVCRGVEGAQCLTISRCGERYPVFLLTDGTLAQCSNGQPVDVARLTCSERCNVDPCAGQTCSMHPDAICVRTACTCNEPMWLLADTGVQVDCDTGEQLSPEEAKERRRRKRDTGSGDAQRTSCS